MNRIRLTIATIAIAFSLLFGLGLLASLEVNAQGGMTTFNGMKITTFIRFQPRTTVTMTQDATLNPSGTFVRLTAAGAVSTSGASITVKPPGTYLILVNVGAQTITFTETGTLKSAGNIALGALDSATLISDGTNYYQVAASNN